MDGQDGGSEPINPPNPQAGASPVPENSDGAMADNNATMGTGVGAGGALASTGGPIFSDPSLTIEKDAIPEEISGVEQQVVTLGELRRRLRVQMLLGGQLWCRAGAMR